MDENETTENETAPAPAEGGKYFKRLARAVEWSRSKLKPFREKQLDMLKQLAGFNYGEGGTKDKVPANELRKFIRTYVRRMAARNPKALIRTRFKEIKSRAFKFELGLNHLIRELDLKVVLRGALVQSFTSMGIIRTGMKATGEIEYEGYLIDAGQPYAATVSLDDWVHDMSATDLRGVDFCGHHYRVPLEWARENQLFNREAREKLVVTNFLNRSNSEGERAEELSQGGSHWDNEQYKDYCDLMDLWLPKENMLVTCAADDPAEPLMEQQWEGPETGPYRFLYYETVPGNSMPLAPATDLVDQHDIINRVYNKLARQVERQKTITLFRPVAAEDSKMITEAADGDAVASQDPTATREARFGGADQQNFAFLMWAMQDFDQRAGNLSAMGGLGPQADTFGQEQLISQTVSQVLAEMQEDFVDFTRQVMEDLGWYLWHDPFIELPLVHRDARTGIEMPVSFTPEDREGDFYQYNLSIEPYSMTHQTPQGRLQTIEKVLQSMILPAADQLAAQGMAVNWEGILRLVARYTDMAELEEILQFAAPDPLQPGPVQPAGAPGRGVPGAQSGYKNTNRTYTRVNRPGNTRQGAAQAMIAKMMGVGQQPAEAAAATRPIG